MKLIDTIQIKRELQKQLDLRKDIKISKYKQSILTNTIVRDTLYSIALNIENKIKKKYNYNVTITYDFVKVIRISLFSNLMKHECLEIPYVIEDYKIKFFSADTDTDNVYGKYDFNICKSIDTNMLFRHIKSLNNEVSGTWYEIEKFKLIELLVYGNTKLFNMSDSIYQRYAQVSIDEVHKEVEVPATEF